MKISQKIGLAIVFSWFFFGGVGHFVITDFFVSIVPPSVPWPVMAVYVSGVFEILGAIGILLPATRRLAGAGLFLLTLAVTPANIHMWLNPDLFPDFPPFVLTFRLVLQVALLICIALSTELIRSVGLRQKVS